MAENSLSEVERLRAALKAAEEKCEALRSDKEGLLEELAYEKHRVEEMSAEKEVMRRKSLTIQQESERDLRQHESDMEEMNRKFETLKKEKECLIRAVELEEEYLTNTLQRKLDQVRREKVEIENQLEVEQEFIVNRLQKELEARQARVSEMQAQLEKLQREKIDLENTLEQEQEFMVNRLQKRLDYLENERRQLRQQLSVSPHAGRSSPLPDQSADKAEIIRLRRLIAENETEQQRREKEYAAEQHRLQSENFQLQKRVMREIEKISSLEREVGRFETDREVVEERIFNDLLSHPIDPSKLRSQSSPLLSADCGTIERRPSLNSQIGKKWWFKRSDPKSPSNRLPRSRTVSSSDAVPDTHTSAQFLAARPSLTLTHAHSLG